MVTADSMQKHQSKTGQRIPKHPACIGYTHGKVLCEFLIFSLKNIRMSQGNAAIAAFPQQHSCPSAKVSSTTVLLFRVALCVS